MQTFVPCDTFLESAHVLDRQRLGKQRVEAMQILTALLYAHRGKHYGWQNHPAVVMWSGHELALVSYGIAICDEWVKRGYQDTCMQKITKLGDDFRSHGVTDESYPEWWGDWRVHDSHRSNLLRKLPSHYKQYWPNMSSSMPYYWPNQSKAAAS